MNTVKSVLCLIMPYYLDFFFLYSNMKIKSIVSKSTKYFISSDLICFLHLTTTVPCSNCNYGVLQTLNVRKLNLCPYVDLRFVYLGEKKVL